MQVVNYYRRDDQHLDHFVKVNFYHRETGIFGGYNLESPE